MRRLIKRKQDVPDRLSEMPSHLRPLFDSDSLAKRSDEVRGWTPAMYDSLRVTEAVSPFGRVFREGVRTVFKVVHDRAFIIRNLPSSGKLMTHVGAHVRRVPLSESSLLLYRPYGARVRGRRPRTILHVHGGGFVAGLGNHYRSVARTYLQVPTADLVASVDYRYLPDHPFPAGLEDVAEAWRYLLAQGCDPSDVVMVGDSAGANLILALLLKLRDEGAALPLGACLESPWTDMTFSGDSIYGNLYRDPMFGVAEGRVPDWREYRFLIGYSGDYPPDHPYVSPVFGDYTGLPQMLIQVGSDEMLFSDGLRVFQACERAGVPARMSVYEGMFHSFSAISGAWTQEGQIARHEAFAAILGMWDGHHGIVRDDEDELLLGGIARVRRGRRR